MPALVFLACVFVFVGCSGSKRTDSTGASSKPEPALPSDEAELQALLPTATPQLRIAIKGKLRRLQGFGKLSFQRAAVVGASLSAGFGGLQVSTAIDEAIASEHQNINLASVFFFKSPHANGRDQIDQAIDADASVIFALDILFWYVYINASLDSRISSLERALKNLERASMPIILGDIPDMRTGQPWMLPPEVIPPPEHLEALNARLHEWARGRLEVHLVPLAAWSEALVAGGDIVVEPGKPPVPAKSLVHIDGLHPNPKGLRYMLKLLDPSLEIAFPDTKEEALAF